MHGVWRYLGLRQHSVDQLSSLLQYVAMRRERMVPRKHGMVVLMIALKEAEMKAEDISVHMHNEKTETKQLKDKVKITTGTVHAGEINKTTRLTLSTEK